jgi:hypothetical protein
MKKFLLFIFIIFFFCVNFTNSIYFMITKGSTKCFFEEFYKNNIVSLRYNTLEELHEEGEHEHTPIFTFTLYNLDKEKEVDSLQGINPSGKVNFIISENASYSFCVSPRRDAKVFEHTEIIKLSITLDNIEENSEEKDFSNVPKNKDVEKINKRADKMHKHILDFMKTQNYQINKEEQFIERQNANSSVIIYMTAIQIIILFILTIWQVSSFKNLFKEQLSDLIH